MKKSFLKNSVIISGVLACAFAAYGTAEAFKPIKPGAPDMPKPGIQAIKADGGATSEVKAINNTKVVQMASPLKVIQSPVNTGEVSAESRSAINYQLPANTGDSFETTIEKLSFTNAEVPETIVLATVAKMKTNPHIATTAGDFTKIAKDAFRSRITPSSWRAVHSSFYMNKSGEDDTLYIIIAVECKKDMAPEAFKKEVSDLKRYMKRESSDEYVILEKFPYWVVIASNQNGDYEFSIIKDLGERMKIKLFGAAQAVAPSAVTYDNNIKNPQQAQTQPAKEASSVTGNSETHAAGTNETQIKSGPAAGNAGADVKAAGSKDGKESDVKKNEKLKAEPKGVIISEDKKDDKAANDKTGNKTEAKDTKKDKPAEPEEEITAEDEE